MFLHYLKVTRHLGHLFLVLIAHALGRALSVIFIFLTQLCPFLSLCSERVGRHGDSKKPRLDTWKSLRMTGLTSYKSIDFMLKNSCWFQCTGQQQVHWSLITEFLRFNFLVVNQKNWSSKFLTIRISALVADQCIDFFVGFGFKISALRRCATHSFSLIQVHQSQLTRWQLVHRNCSTNNPWCTDMCRVPSRGAPILSTSPP